MKILIDIGHPAHVHIFKHFARDVVSGGNQVLFTCREREVITELLDSYGFKYVSFGKSLKGITAKLLGMLRFDLKLYRIARKFKPDIILSHGSIYGSHVAALMKKPHISLEDTGNMEQIHLYRPFTKVILTPSCFHKDLGKKQFQVKSYHELAYLNPRVFRADDSFLNLLGVIPDEPYFILRFISWNASHDIGHTGLSVEEKIILTRTLANHGKVFISSEGELPNELNKYQLRIPADKMHDALYFATMFIGESLTMVSECAALGTPAIHVNTMTAGTLREQEEYGLIFRYSSGKGLVDKALSLLDIPDLKSEWHKRRNRMLDDKIDLTRLLVWLMEDYPENMKLLISDPGYQDQFSFKQSG